MSHTFKLTRDDFRAFQKEVGKLLRKRIPRGWGFALQFVIWLCIGLAASAYVRLYQGALEYRRPLALVGVLVIVAIATFLLARMLAGRLAQRHLLMENGSLLSPQTIAIDEEGFTLSASGGLATSRFVWAAFIGRTEDARNFYLFLDASYALIIPKGVVCEPFEELLRKRIGEL